MKQETAGVKILWLIFCLSFLVKAALMLRDNFFPLVFNFRSHVKMNCEHLSARRDWFLSLRKWNQSHRSHLHWILFESNNNQAPYSVTLLLSRYWVDSVAVVFFQRHKCLFEGFLRRQVIKWRLSGSFLQRWERVKQVFTHYDDGEWKHHGTLVTAFVPMYYCYCTVWITPKPNLAGNKQCDTTGFCFCTLKHGIHKCIMC